MTTPDSIVEDLEPEFLTEEDESTNFVAGALAGMAIVTATIFGGKFLIRKAKEFKANRASNGTVVEIVPTKDETQD